MFVQCFEIHLRIIPAKQCAMTESWMLAYCVHWFELICMIFKILTVSMKDLAAGLNPKFRFTYTSLIFVACNAEPVTRGIGAGGVMHTNQIKPVHAVRSRGALFGWADSEMNFEKLDKHALPLWMIYYSKCYEWSCCKFWHFSIKNWTGAVSARIHARTWKAAGCQRRTGTWYCALVDY